MNSQNPSARPDLKRNRTRPVAIRHFADLVVTESVSLNDPFWNAEPVGELTS
jgi:hypothetical protein